MPAGSGYKAAMELKGQGWDGNVDFVPKAKKSLNWRISDLDEKIRSIEHKHGRSNSRLPGLHKKLKQLREES
jgi:hypothetical protein